MTEPRFLAAGDCALVAEFGNDISEELNARVIALARSLETDPVAGIIETVPTYRSLLVYFDPLTIRASDLARMLSRRVSLSRADPETEYRVVEIPVRYGDKFGEDLPSVSQHTGLPAEEIVERHSSRDYLVYMLGFLPGFAYLGGMDAKLATPRLASPRRKIPAGSVAIGGEQTGVYPVASPGGWRLIGTTPVALYDPSASSPILLHAGDRVRFRPVTDAEFNDISECVSCGSYKAVTAIVKPGRTA